MHYRKLSVCRQMRVCICITGDTVRSPSGVTYTAYTLKIGFRLKFVNQMAHLSGCFKHFYRIHIISFIPALDGYTCRIVSSVFKSFKAFKQYRTCLVNTCVSGYSAHDHIPFPSKIIFIFNLRIIPAIDIKKAKYPYKCRNSFASELLKYTTVDL